MEAALPILIFLGVCFVFGLYVWLTRSPKLTMRPGEFVHSHIFAETRQIKWGGFVAVGNVHYGKLLLTNQRLIYTSPDQRKLGFALTPAEIKLITKGQKGPMMTMELSYLTPNNKTKVASFTQLAGGIANVKIDPRQQLPIGMFIDRVMAWRDGQQLPPMGAPGMPGAGVRGPGTTA